MRCEQADQLSSVRTIENMGAPQPRLCKNAKVILKGGF